MHKVIPLWPGLVLALLVVVIATNAAAATAKATNVAQETAVPDTLAPPTAAATATIDRLAAPPMITATATIDRLAAPPTPAATATIDRLAAPATVIPPDQADDGAQLYWLHCQPCHGDRGQGLTDAEDDDWRAQYPVEDQYCWNSGCHGDRPYEGGFTLPRAVPPVLGTGSLDRFATMQEVHAYVAAAMPRQAPGALTAEEYLAISAFLARGHGLWEGTPLEADNLAQFRLRPGDSQPPVPATATAVPQLEAAPAIEDNTREESVQAGENRAAGWLFPILGLAFLFIGGFALWRRAAR